MVAAGQRTVVIGGKVCSRDGRRRLREMSRYRVIDVTLALIREGRAVPTVGEIAARAQISECSIFRSFDDANALLEAAIGSEVAGALERELTIATTPGGAF